MIVIVLLFAFLLVDIGVILLLRPAVLLRLLEKYKNKPVLRLLAIVVRLLFGVLLLILAERSRFPVAIAVIGGIAVLAAVVLLLMGKGRFQRLMDWALSMSHVYYRLAALATIALGGFLFYAFL